MFSQLLPTDGNALSAFAFEKGIQPAKTAGDHVTFLRVGNAQRRPGELLAMDIQRLAVP